MNDLKIRVFVVVFLLASIPASAKNKERFVDYRIEARSTAVETEMKRYFIQMGYVIDSETSKQCSDHPPGTMVFRHTGEGQTGISGLSRCVIVTITEEHEASTVHVELYDHLRGGFSLPATKHWDADHIHKDLDATFGEIRRVTEAANKKK